MKPSEQLFVKLMHQYLDEYKNFADEQDEARMCENLFNKTKFILSESEDKTNGFKIMSDLADNEEEKQLVKDFRMYVKLILEQ
jgi:hypothetical protein